MSHLFAALRRACAHQGGATALEYGLIVSLIGVLVAGAVTATGSKIYNKVNVVSTTLGS